MNQCPYQIKDALDIGWWNCQLEAGHEHREPHKAPPAPHGKKREFEGIWHRPGEKSTADPEPYIPFIGNNQIVPAKTSEDGTINHPLATTARSTK